ncbi:hypothetical protein CDD82_423 [Ophiocordyceps australis]|uniref:Uncharacterized protein n=1 Tax=Ophiocordyceps australis TaxID=1399860 RepID=A0A2C5YLK2_9HYPO|nr:hypothetical protein CDD82_423 [Ophiocordyceps australis]
MLRRAPATAARCSRPTLPRPFAVNLLPARNINRSFWWRRTPKNLPTYFPRPPKPPIWRRWGVTAGRVSLKIFALTFCFFLVGELVLDPLFDVFEEFDGLLDDLTEGHGKEEDESDDDDDNDDDDGGTQVVFVTVKEGYSGEDGGEADEQGKDEEIDHIEFDQEFDHKDEDVWNLKVNHFKDGDEDELGRSSSSKNRSSKSSTSHSNRGGGGGGDDDDDDDDGNNKNKGRSDKANVDNDGSQTSLQPRYTEKDYEYGVYDLIHFNDKLKQGLQVSLITTVRTAIYANPALMSVLGTQPIEFCGGELGFEYPARPPPKIYIPGIGLSSGSIFLGYQEISPIACQMLLSAMYPKAVANAAWTFCRTFVEQTAHNVGKSLGINTGATTKAQHPTGSGTSDAQRSPPKNGAPLLEYPLDDANKTFAYLHRSLGGAFPWVWKKLLQAQADDSWREPVNCSLMSFAKNWSPPLDMPRGGYLVIKGSLNFAAEKVEFTVRVEGIFDFTVGRFTRVIFFSPKTVHKEQRNQQQLRPDPNQQSTQQSKQHPKQQPQNK